MVNPNIFVHRCNSGSLFNDPMATCCKPNIRNGRSLPLSPLSFDDEDGIEGVGITSSLLLPLLLSAGGSDDEEDDDDDDDEDEENNSREDDTIIEEESDGGVAVV